MYDETEELPLTHEQSQRWQEETSVSEYSTCTMRMHVHDLMQEGSKTLKSGSNVYHAHSTKEQKELLPVALVNLKLLQGSRTTAAFCSKCVKTTVPSIQILPSINCNRSHPSNCRHAHEEVDLSAKKERGRR
jgi:hypothetical protein